jgi:putative ABC transport system permease protein
MHFFVLGSGITADFIYPIVNIQHSTPNPNKECILFSNTNGYKRVFDAFRGQPTENYLVGKFKDGFNKNETLNLINAEASKIMN